MMPDTKPASSKVRSLPAAAASPSMVDSFGRRIEYLRISVTDKCNLRCVYCMPVEGLPWLKRDEILDYEEIARVVRTMAKMGLRRLRITGGEPLVRRDLSSLIRMLSAIDGIENIALSTNAVLARGPGGGPEGGGRRPGQHLARFAARGPRRHHRPASRHARQGAARAGGGRGGGLRADQDQRRADARLQRRRDRRLRGHHPRAPLAHPLHRDHAHRLKHRPFGRQLHLVQRSARAGAATGRPQARAGPAGQRSRRPTTASTARPAPSGSSPP